MEFGDKVKKLRISMGLTQEVFGKKFDIGQKYVSAIEKGKSKANKTLLTLLFL